MSRKTSVDQTKFTEILSLYQGKPFFGFFKALMELSGIEGGSLSIKLGHIRSFIFQAEKEHLLLREEDVLQSLKIMRLNGDFAAAVRKRWRENYETEMEKLFLNSADQPFPALLQAVRKSVGVSSLAMSDKLGKYSAYLTNVEEKNGFLPEELAERAAEILCLEDDFTKEFMARWKKHYDGWKTRPRKKRVKPDNREKLNKIFLECDEQPFPVLFKAIRELAGVTPSSLSRALKQGWKFIEGVENSTVKITREVAERAAGLFGLGEDLTREFMTKWEEDINQKPDSGEKKIIPPLPPNQQIPVKKPSKLESIIESPLGRLANFLCFEAGLSRGLESIHQEFVHHDGKVNPFNLGTEADNSSRLAAACALADRLKLGPRQIRELSTVLYVNYPGKCFIAVEGGSMDFYDLAISLATKALRISAVKD